MRAAALVLLVLALAAPAEARWRPDVKAARAYADGRPGAVSFSVRTRCGVWGARQDTAMPGASLLKPLLMVAQLRRGHRAHLAPMIRRSDDAAAGAVIGALGAPRIERVARRLGLNHFALLDPWGLSPTTAREQSRLFLRIDRSVPRRQRRYARRLLRTVVPAQRWGIARAVPRSWTLHFKGGWGGGTGWVDHQSALLTRDRRRVALSVLTRDVGSHAAGNRTLRGVARRLTRGLGRARGLC